MHEDLVDALAHAPTTIFRVTSSIAADVAGARPSADEWSITEIIGHIRAADTIWRARALLTLVHDGVTVVDVDERALQAVQATAGVELDTQVTSFALDRAELVGILRALPDAGWSRTCSHTKAGAMTLLDVCAALEAHEREHLEQLRTAAQ